MATPFNDNGTGTTIVFATSAFLAAITKISAKGANRKSLEFTKMTSTVREFKPSDLVDYGEIEIDMQWDTKQATANIPPIAGVLETVTITLPIPSGLTNGATIAGSAFVVSFDGPDSPLEDVMTAKVTLKWAGAVTYAAAS